MAAQQMSLHSIYTKLCLSTNFRETTKVVQHNHLGDHQYYQLTDGHIEANRNATKGFNMPMIYLS